MDSFWRDGAKDVVNRVWQGVIGAAALGAIVTLVLRASTSAARGAPSARPARGAEDPAGSPRADESDRPARRPARAAKRRRRKTKANVWTVPHGDGWANKREGAERVAKVFPTKDAARAAGRATAIREKVEHVILKRDGQIGERKSYGRDPARATRRP